MQVKPILGFSESVSNHSSYFLPVSLGAISFVSDSSSSVIMLLHVIIIAEDAIKRLSLIL
jgi:hypothetical protein